MSWYARLSGRGIVAIELGKAFLLGIRTQGKIGYSGTRTQINVVLTITLNTLGSVFLTVLDP